MGDAYSYQPHSHCHFFLLLNFYSAAVVPNFSSLPSSTQLSSSPIPTVNPPNIVHVHGLFIHVVHIEWLGPFYFQPFWAIVGDVQLAYRDQAKSVSLTPDLWQVSEHKSSPVLRRGALVTWPWAGSREFFKGTLRLDAQTLPSQHPAAIHPVSPPEQLSPLLRGKFLRPSVRASPPPLHTTCTQFPPPYLSPTEKQANTLDSSPWHFIAEL